MKASISPLSIYIIGLCLFLICLSYGYSQYAPNASETKLIKENTDALNAEGDKKPQATKRVQTALKTVEAKQDEWKGIVETRTPANSVAGGGIDISENGWQLAVDSQKFRNNIQRALNYQLKRGGVTVLSGPQIPFPTDSGAEILSDFYNYPALSFPVVEFDLGTIEVEGTYKQICDNVRSYSTMPNYLAVVDGLRLEGTSPKLRATYDLSLLGYIKGTHLFTTPPELASTSSTAGGGSPFGGGGRGGPGGFGGPGGAGRGGPGGPGGIPAAPGGSRGKGGGAGAQGGD